MVAETPRAAVRAWRDGLVNLDAGNRLLTGRRSAGSTLEIAGPAAPEIVGALRDGRDYGFLPYAARPEPGGLFRTNLSASALGTRLRRLMRRSRQDLLDRGIATLHLAIGTLHWRDEEDAAFTSPILLLPAELTARGPGDVPRLHVRGDDPVVNPALALRLRRMGIATPDVDGLAELDVRACLEKLRSTVSNRAWEITEGVLLSCFSFHKEAMYRDLLDNERRVVTHPLVEALAGQVGTKKPGGQPREGSTGGVVSEPPLPGGWAGIPTRTAEGAQPGPAQRPGHGPERELPLVLDADATQRACVEAAVAGQSFVLDGPPGTGKSQTIANMIGCLLHAGKRVLFVSEKAAALEVVRNRLAGVGLDRYLLELHSHKTTRREVARTLAASLDETTPGPARPTGEVDRERLNELRDRLDAYATAMNERREPLGRSLYDVIGECARRTEPHAAGPMPAVDPRTLTPELVQRLLEAADDLARCRRPAEEGDRFPWRDVTEQNPLTDTLRRARHALRDLAGETQTYATTTEAFALTHPSDAGRLAALVTHAAHRPAVVTDEWLTAPSLEPIARAAERRGRLLSAARQARTAVREAAGVDWPDVPDEEPPALDPGTLTAHAAEVSARLLTAEAGTIDEVVRDAATIAARLGLPAVVTFGDLARVAALAALADRPHRPEPFWFGPGVLTAVSSAAAVLRRCSETVAAIGALCRAYFAESIVDQPVEQLAERLVHEHRGLRKLLGAYRRDWNAVAAFALPTVSPAEAVANLGVAVGWQRALRHRAVVERQHAPLLGRYQHGDPSAIDEALRTAGDLLRLAPPESLPSVADQICRPDPDPALIRFARRARTVAERQPPADLLRDAVEDRRARAAPLTEAAAVLHAFDRATGREVDLDEARRLLDLKKAAAEKEQAVADDPAPELGHDDLDDAVAWARAARRLPNGVDRALSPEQAAALQERPGAAGLAERIGAWEDARDSVLAAFAPTRRPGLATALDDYDGAFLTTLLDDVDGQEQWLGYDRARRVLPAATIAHCVERGTGFREEVERAVLTAWADAVIRDDERLHPLGGVEHDHLVDEFRRLDAALAAEAPVTIAAAIEARKPSVADEIALLRREGSKQTRHCSVRDLLARARQTVQAARPCFLMSPRAVSQFLPADLTFDVVIFDEASQIAPADAINGIYRADALIAAGDDRQLPPTSFFSTRADEDDGTDVNDFESILELAEGCGAFPRISLGWHYRSRHEALIAFANHRFYQGRLMTFPSAGADPETGIDLVPAGGVYRRGGARDNPIEAETVAERIVSCLTTRPELSLGVVTFSVAQAEAIESALERAALRHPGLDRLLEGDRLTGFFIKSLESVQGDERDVMIFSIGYGRDENGRISSNFGALNQPNGWRRLNVAITRARRRVEIISSVRSRDIPPSTNPGVRLLAAYLDYAERGAAAVAGPTVAANPLVTSVLETIRGWGFRAEAALNTDGYRVGIGVRRHAPGGGFVLGVECDGPLYGSIAAARDRDRLTAEILTGLGWRLHRVWSTAWHHDPAGERARLRAAIEQAAGELPTAGPWPYRRDDLLRLQPVL
ncbi:DUF4011 domain-containing protein [Actinoplanes solisilvae]|uniref:DUF4011 domain-containing protein n=1 Tax=Actinoplanes solisilvae TaxID=2486853 RepID=UPI000FD9CA4F|nr:DUF4011 domain-containing protein [Actinoplanes solisilvae]